MNREERRRQNEQRAYERGCKNKRKMTEREAKNEARFLSSSQKVRIEPYLCDFCDHWHVGHR